jgi:hypothetical protein
MTRITLVVGLCVLAVAGSGAAAAGAAGTARPLLGVTDTSPFAVRGAGFEPGERVQVLLALNGRQHWQAAVASSAGVFRVSFRASLGPCGRYTLRAFGSKGSSARTVPRRLQPDCVSPSTGSPRA